VNGTTRAKKTNGTRRTSGRLSSDNRDEDDAILQGSTADDSLQLVHDSPLGNSIHDDTVEQPAEEESAEEEVRPKPGRRGRPKGVKASKPVPVAEEDPPAPPTDDPGNDDDDDDDDEDVVVSRPGRKPGRPAKKVAPNTSKRRTRASPDGDEEGEEAEEDDGPRDRSKKRQKTSSTAQPKPAAAPAIAPTKRRGRKPKSQAQARNPPEDTSILEVQRGPPLPKARGLVSIRRDANSIVQTRSGRHSYKPLEFWKGEHVTYDNEEVQDDTYRNRRMVLPSIKEVIRVEDDEEDTRRARKKHTRGRKPTGKRRAAAQEEGQEEDEQEEPEEWERDPGVISGDVVLWEPQHELYPPSNDAHVEVVEDQLAVSSDAILTRDIHDASFRFAKTLNMSFMGSGIVDLPPGAEKKPKNSRKMQMVFFVFYGKVLVTVNETEFRISAGGQWFVPRGMFAMALFVATIQFFVGIEN